MDVFSKDVRSKIMSHVANKNTKPERVLGSYLHLKGFRYRKNVSGLPGHPDFVFPKFKSVIFVHGCFWHRHDCKKATMPSTNVAFWEKKFARNVERDREVSKKLVEQGWRVLIVWECELSSKTVSLTVENVSEWLKRGVLLSSRHVVFIVAFRNQCFNPLPNVFLRE